MRRCLICLEEFADGDELKTHLGTATGGFLADGKCSEFTLRGKY